MCIGLKVLCPSGPVPGLAGYFTSLPLVTAVPKPKLSIDLALIGHNCRLLIIDHGTEIPGAAAIQGDRRLAGERRRAAWGSDAQTVPDQAAFCRSARHAMPAGPRRSTFAGSALVCRPAPPTTARVP